jgi:hypothetical protein
LPLISCGILSSLGILQIIQLEHSTDAAFSTTLALGLLSYLYRIFSEKLFYISALAIIGLLIGQGVQVLWKRNRWLILIVVIIFAANTTCFLFTIMMTPD